MLYDFMKNDEIENVKKQDTKEFALTAGLTAACWLGALCLLPDQSFVSMASSSISGLVVLRCLNDSTKEKIQEFEHELEKQSLARPLADSPLAEKIMPRLQQIDGVALDKIYVYHEGKNDTNSPAVLCPNKQIILDEAELGLYTADEIAVMVAHEMGHDVVDPARKKCTALTNINLFGAGYASVWALRNVGGFVFQDIFRGNGAAAQSPEAVLSGLGLIALAGVVGHFLARRYDHQQETSADAVAALKTNDFASTVSMFVKMISPYDMYNIPRKVVFKAVCDTFKDQKLTVLKLLPVLARLEFKRLWERHPPTPERINAIRKLEQKVSATAPK